MSFECEGDALEVKWVPLGALEMRRGLWGVPWRCHGDVIGALWVSWGYLEGVMRVPWRCHGMSWE